MSYYFIDTTDHTQVVVGRKHRDKVTWRTMHVDTSSEDRHRTFFSFLARTVRTRSKKDGRRAQGIVVVVGPGRFSATRIGVVVANAFGYAYNVPVVGVERGDDPSRETLFRDAVSSLCNKKKFQKSVTPVYDREPNITRC